MINVNDNFIPSIFMKIIEWNWTSGAITGTLFDSRGKGGRHGGILNGQALQKELGKNIQILYLDGLCSAGEEA